MIIISIYKNQRIELLSVAREEVFKMSVKKKTKIIDLDICAIKIIQIYALLIQTVKSEHIME